MNIVRKKKKPTSCKFTRGCKGDFDHLAKAARVIIHESLCVAKGLQNHISLEDREQK